MRLSARARATSILIGASLFLVSISEARKVAGEGGQDDNLRSRLAGFAEHPVDAAAGEALRIPVEVGAFYRARAGAPAWLDAEGSPSVEVAVLIDLVRAAGRDGLAPSDYHAEALDRLAADTASPDRAAALELLLTDAFLSLADHLSSGRLTPSAVDPAWAVKRKRLDVKKQLTTALRGKALRETLEALTPTDNRYKNLKAALEAYRALQERGPFPTVAAGAKLRVGSRGDRVIALRSRLARENYPLASATSKLFDESLEAAVKLFQTVHGLEPNGVVGASTLAELNLPLETRLRQIEINLERLRWLPRDLGDRYILVDVAGFSLTVFDNGQPQTTMRVIVGADKNRTPILDAKVRSVVINPSWAVPSRIARQELLPRLKANPGSAKNRQLKIYNLSRGRMQELDVRDVDWSRVMEDKFHYMVEEKNHSGNPLGSIKFVFPNEFSVYLHGTPDKKLFAREKRTLSHGCVRVEDPIALAGVLLRGNPRWGENEIQEAIDIGTQVLVPLPQPIPVHLWYRTAWVDEEGRVQFRGDIYGWDDKVAAAIGRGAGVGWRGPVPFPLLVPGAVTR